jgi:hypothetical protein
LSEYLNAILIAVGGGITIYFSKYLIKAAIITYFLDIDAERRVGTRASLVVTNRSWFPATGASLMVTIEDMSVGDIQDVGTPRLSAYISTEHQAIVIDTFLCWSFAHSTNLNPPVIDLLSKQRLQAAFINIHDGTFPKIEIASENCFYDPTIPGSKSMVFLKSHKYSGTIKFFSIDSFTKTKTFEYDPADKDHPLRVF